ncbi:protein DETOXIFICATION 45, chloroplastic [Syzygium oleosum]|uniref:protein DETOXIFICATION 45, chloroplastic n=1 Tax=Syzygium oleosum TaxID=219896 RepID=UPI0024B8BCAA|nr:protein DETOXIFICATION 45, chloroplastic [Syzygium oleosum]
MSAAAARLAGASVSSGLTGRPSELGAAIRRKRLLAPVRTGGVCSFSALVDRNRFRSCGCRLSANRGRLSLLSVRGQLSSDCGVGSVDVDECVATSSVGDELPPRDDPRTKKTEEATESTAIPRGQSHITDVKRELIALSLPALAGQAIEPLAQLMETAYIGRLGTVELGSAGVSISIFNIISKLFNIPLLSVATSFVAEDLSKTASKDSASEEGILESNSNHTGKPFTVAERKQLSSVSTALLLAVGIGIFEAIALYFGSGQFLNMMGVSSESPMHSPAHRILSLRALGAPAVVASLALQGIFRGFKDTKTPVLCLGIGNLAAVFLFPVLMYGFRLGVVGAALSTVASQYLVALLMIWYLNKRVILLPPKMGALQFGGYIKSGGFLLGRTLAVLTTMTVGTSMAARQGPLAMAAHQICMQVWLAVSLLTDALAASAQALIAGSLSKSDYRTVREVTDFILKIGLLTGISLAAILLISFGSLANLFTNDADVLLIVKTGVLFVSASQPLNALAYIFDGLHYGVSDFPYAAYSMMLVGTISSAFLLFAPRMIGLPGVWLGFSLFMGLRTAAGYFRLSAKTGPWWFMHREMQKFEVNKVYSGFSHRLR